MKKTQLVVTLFEHQIMRNLITNNNGKLMINLVNNFDVTILTHSDMQVILVDLLKRLKVQNVTVEVVNPLDQNILYKLLGVFARNMNASSSNSWSRNRSYALKYYSLPGFILRKIINKLFAKRRSAHRIVRSLMMRLAFTRQLKLDIILNSCELVVLTSATNFKWDVIIGQIALRKKKKLVAIPRSWDNFTSHGALRVNPDKIYSFSTVMSKYLNKYHFINKDQIVEIKNPAYDNKVDILMSDKSGLLKSQKVLYACMGPYLFEQESILIEDLSKIISKTDFDLEILIHPKFETEFSEKIYSKRIPYEEFSNQNLLQEYLSTFRLVLTAGSSVALDCYTYDIDFSCLFIETLPIDYSRSVKRYADSVEHFTDFIAFNKVEVLNNYDELTARLNSLNDSKYYQADGTKKEIYDTTRLISNELVSTIYSILDT
jgi:hypothetical protein